MFPNMEDAEINSRLVGYCSDQVICMKMIIDLIIILAIDHLMINRATALIRSYIKMIIGMLNVDQ